MTMPAKELADLVDHWWVTREKRLAADKAAAALKEEEHRAQASILEEMRTQELSSIGGVLVGVVLKKGSTPAVKDWDVFYNYVRETGDFSLLQRRIGAAAIEERWAAGVTVPGVEAFPVFKLSKQGVK